MFLWRRTNLFKWCYGVRGRNDQNTNRNMDCIQFVLKLNPTGDVTKWAEAQRASVFFRPNYERLISLLNLLNLIIMDLLCFLPIFAGPGILELKMLDLTGEELLTQVEKRVQFPKLHR